MWKELDKPLTVREAVWQYILDHSKMVEVNGKQVREVHFFLKSRRKFEGRITARKKGYYKYEHFKDIHKRKEQ